MFGALCVGGGLFCPGLFSLSADGVNMASVSVGASLKLPLVSLSVVFFRADVGVWRFLMLC